MDEAAKQWEQLARAAKGAERAKYAACIGAGIGAGAGLIFLSLLTALRAGLGFDVSGWGWGYLGFVAFMFAAAFGTIGAMFGANFSSSGGFPD